MYSFTKDDIDLDDLRARLRKMTDAELIAFGKAARHMCSPAANLGKPPPRAVCDPVEGSEGGVEAEADSDLKAAEPAKWP